MIFLMWCWILLETILLRMFESMFMKILAYNFPFLVHLYLDLVLEEYWFLLNGILEEHWC
jgi:hypothetical protein